MLTHSTMLMQVVEQVSVPAWRLESRANKGRPPWPISLTEKAIAVFAGAGYPTAPFLSIVGRGSTSGAGAQGCGRLLLKSLVALAILIAALLAVVLLGDAPTIDDPTEWMEADLPR